MREIRLSGLEGGGAVIRSPYPYPLRVQGSGEVNPHLRPFPKDRGRDGELNAAPPSEPDWRISRIRLSS